MLWRKFWNDESGFIVSAELVLVATIVIIGLLVGLVEVQWALVGELNDVGDAMGSFNQSFQFCGFSVGKGVTRSNFSIQVSGSFFIDFIDECDTNQCALGCDVPVPETPKT